MRKREKRIRAELKRIGTKRFGHGWAANQASKRANRGARLTMRTVRRRLKRKGGVGV